jgi:hypothetical protein
MYFERRNLPFIAVLGTKKIMGGISTTYVMEKNPTIF